jgi:hypothetical protein
MSEEKRETMKWIIWINLIFGFHNLYLYVNNNYMFNLIIGMLNIGVWVFNRNIIFNRGKNGKRK